MRDYITAFLISFGVLLGGAFWIAKGSRDWWQFVEVLLSKTRWKGSAKAILNVSVASLIVATLIAAWAPIVFKAKPAEIAATTSEAGPIPNRQADEMAEEFEAILRKLVEATKTKPLEEHEAAEYSDYLTVTLPVMIASVCGKREFDQYCEFLRHVKSTDSLHQQFAALRPFVTRKRYLQPDTPMVGELIKLSDELAKDLPPRKSNAEAIAQASGTVKQDRPAASLTPGPQLLPDDGNEEMKPIQEKNVAPIDPPATLTPKLENRLPTQLDVFLAKDSWARCPHCGQRNIITFQALTQSHIFSCAYCRGLMDVSQFSARVNKEIQRLINGTSRRNLLGTDSRVS